MTNHLTIQFAEAVAANELSGLDLGDARREARARLLLAGMLSNASASVRLQQTSAAATKGAYRLLENELVDASAILEPHIQQTVIRACAHRTVLALQDTTAVSLSTLVAAEGLGPITDTASSRGYLVHSTLMVAESTGEVLGVGAQQVWVRPATKRDASERPDQRKKRARESQHWSEGQKKVARAFGRELEPGKWRARTEDEPYVIAVFDREGDIFETLEDLVALGHGYVIRAVQNRQIESMIDAPKPRYSLDEVERGPVVGVYEVLVPRRGGVPVRPATLTARSASMRLRPPRNRGRRGNAILVNMVLVREETPPPDVDALCWWLLTSEPVATTDDVRRVIDIYRRRWLIEEFHMGLKTGAGVEDRQFESFDVHERFLSLASIVAWQMLALRDAARQAPNRPAQTILTDTQLIVLRSLVPKLPGRPTARDALRAIAGLGGFMGRKGDGEPGWRTLWWGFQRLLEVESGFLLAKERYGQ